MKSTLDKLSSKEREALARLYETDGYAALKRLHQLEIAGLGQDALVASSMEAKEFLHGRAHQSKVLVELIREAYKLAK